MAMPVQPWTRNVLQTTVPEAAQPEVEPLLPVARAWNTLRRRTGIPLSRATFYRWVSSGKVYSLRMGLKVYVPTSVVDGIVRQCQAGSPLWPVREEGEATGGDSVPGS
jgi:hypothetical protein